MNIDGSWRKVEDLGYLLGGLALFHEVGYLDLFRGKIDIPGGHGLDERRQDLIQVAFYNVDNDGVLSWLPRA